MEYFLEEVSKIMSKDFCELKPTDTVGKALHIMRDYDISVILVMHKRKARRLVSSRHLLRAGVFPNTRLISIAKPAPYLVPDDIILDAAQALVSYKVEAVPVIDSNNVVLGLVTRRDIIKYALEIGWLQPFNVKDAMLKPVIASPSDSASKVRRLIMNHATRQVFIVEDDRLIGVVGIEDILEKIYSITVNRSTTGEIIGETEKILSHPAKFIMSRPIFTVNVEDKLSKAAEIMLKLGVFSTPVLEENSVVGTITRYSIVRMVAALAIMKSLPLSFKGLGKIPQHLLDLANIGISKTLERIARTTKLWEGRVIIKWQNTEGERTLYIFEISIVTAKGIFTASKSGWEPIQVFINALKALERQCEKTLTKKRKAERKKRRMDLFSQL